MTTASFRFGEGDVHELRMEFSWLGAERYYVGDSLVFKHWSLMPSGSREFNAAGHAIRISIQIGRRQIAGQAYVDGSLKSGDLFPELNRKLQRRKPFWVYVATWLAIAFFSFTLTVLLGG
ncbi:MAG TPA: hypothetical protein VGD45_16885 [Steroidobacter sp.]|uniref:hypothetical protein n=1 Tax=Steroidobacter sp. TaxID=1978227 RepID=UPI002ED982B5